MSIRIVTHCYAKKLPQYAQFLKLQLSSLIIHRPSVVVKITVCCAGDDDDTHDVLDDLSLDPDLNMYRLVFSEGDLFRRSIGRNSVALRSKEDLVWFTDVDHCFCNGILDNLQAWYDNEKSDFTMVYPKTLMIHKSHQIGDDLVKRTKESYGIPVDIDQENFTTKSYGRAIGGVQIVKGDYARKHGYLNDHKGFQTPRSDGKAFGDFRDDVKFRQTCKENGRVESIDLPGLFRLRHTEVTYK